MSQLQPSLVIVGSGLAAWTVARELRKLNPTQAITLITRDSGDFYSKPLLSNALASGKSPEQLIGTPRTAMAAQLGVTVLADTTVYAIAPLARTVQTSVGAVPYSQLVLATGADPVRLPLEGDAADQVLSVNDWHDYALFRQRLAGARRVVVVGAGLIGCEFSNDLAVSGYAVTVVDPGLQPLGRLLPPAAGEWMQSALRNAGIDFRFGVSVQAVHATAPGGPLRLALSDGGALEADLVLSAVGLKPRLDLARAAGLQVARGIVVNRQLQSSVPGIYALGDGAEVDGQWLPFVMPLMQAARALAAHLAGQDVSLRYPAMPVVVKTPAAPVVVAPPPPGQAGEWRITVDDAGVDAAFYAADGSLRGFALVGKATGRKASLQKLLPV